jgi:hypothetical protein
VGRPAPELVEPGVAQQDFAGLPGERYGKRRLFDDCPQPRFALPQRLLGPLALGDVLEDNADPATVLSADAEGRRVEPLAPEPSDHAFEVHGLAGQRDAAVVIEPELLEVRDDLRDPLAQHRPRGVPDERRVGLQVAEVDGTAVLAEDHLDDAYASIIDSKRSRCRRSVSRSASSAGGACPRRRSS